MDGIEPNAIAVLEELSSRMDYDSSDQTCPHWLAEWTLYCDNDLSLKI